MHSKAIESEPLRSCDVSKRKRLNRTARLKQCKLDARREQWLSQSKNCSRSEHDLHYRGWKESEDKKGELSSEVFEQDISPNSEELSVNGSTTLSGVFTVSVSDSENTSSVVNPDEDQADSIASGSFLEGHGSNTIIVKACDFTNADKSKIESAPAEFHRSLSQNRANDMLTIDKGNRENPKERRKPSGCRNVLKPCGCTDSLSQMKLKQDHVKDWLESDVSACLSKNGPTSDSSTGSPSRNGNEKPLDEEDWEAAADALYEKTSLDLKETSGLETRTLRFQQNTPVERDHEAKRCGRSNVQNTLLKPDYKPKLNPFFSQSSSSRCCAWMPDDVSRPHTLPVLEKQQSTSRGSSFCSPAFVKNLWPNHVAPAECPICAEELDSTDSSFVPCTCGFCPCLFCVHRIASEDGRCPGCRREYSFAVKSVHSSSMNLGR